MIIESSFTPKLQHIQLDDVVRVGRSTDYSNQRKLLTLRKSTTHESGITAVDGFSIDNRVRCCESVNSALLALMMVDGRSGGGGSCVTVNSCYS